MFFVCLITSTVEDYVKFVNQQKSFEEENCVNVDFALDLSKEEKEVLLNDLMKNKDMIIKVQGSQNQFEPGVFSAGVFSNVDVNYDMPIIEGRFFNAEDFKSNKKEVVIGKEVLKSSIVTTRNGKKYIKKGVEEFEIIGIIGEDKRRSYFDYHLFYKLNNFDIDEMENYTFTLASNRISLHEIEEYVSEKNKEKEQFMNVTVNETGGNSSDTLARAVGIGGLYLMFYGFAAFCAFLTYILALINYINNIKDEIVIRKTYGATTFDLIYEMISRYIGITTIGTVIAVILSYITSQLNIFNGSYFDLRNLSFIVLFNIMILIGIIFSIISLIYINKFQPIEIIKEK